MALQLTNLDDLTREHMLSEVAADITANSLYFGRYLSEGGRIAYPEMLRAATQSGNDESLALELAAPGILMTTAPRRTPSGGVTSAKVRVDAPQMLAEGEFNRFYLRGLCVRVLATKEGRIEVYRARASSKPRPESEAMIGQFLDATTLLADLRTNAGVDTALGLPPGPNSGLSGQIVPS